MRTATTAFHHKLNNGDVVTIAKKDDSLWMMLKCFVMRRSMPVVTKQYKIHNVTERTFTYEIGEE